MASRLANSPPRRGLPVGVPCLAFLALLAPTIAAQGEEIARTRQAGKTRLAPSSFPPAPPRTFPPPDPDVRYPWAPPRGPLTQPTTTPPVILQAEAPTPTHEVVAPIEPACPGEAGPTATWVYTPTMIGANLGLPGTGFFPRSRFPGFPGPVPVPSVRSFNISDNGSPRPLDRVFVNFSFFDDINKAVNRRLGSDFTNVQVYQEVLGVEKTLFDGNTSVELRLPINTVSSDTLVPGLGRTHTARGDLTVALKTAWINDWENGTVLSTGLAVVAPTGTESIAGSPEFVPLHNTTLQPFLGYILQGENVFVQGFSAIDVPMGAGDVTVLINDVGIGYLFRPRPGTGVVQAVVPTVEMHLTTPLNHRGVLAGVDPAGTPDVLAFTTGASLFLGPQAVLKWGISVPVTGPRPYDYEILVQFNYRFGRSVALPADASLAGF